MLIFQHNLCSHKSVLAWNGLTPTGQLRTEIRKAQGMQAGALNIEIEAEIKGGGYSGTGGPSVKKV